MRTVNPRDLEQLAKLLDGRGGPKDKLDEAFTRASSLLVQAVGTKVADYKIPVRGRRGGSPRPRPVHGARRLLHPALARPLLTAGRPVADGDDLVHTVGDGAGAELGTVRRVAGKGRRRHTWRIVRPGLPDVTGRADVDEVGPAGRLLFKGMDATLGVLDMAFRGGESAPDPKKPRFLVRRPETGPGTAGTPEKITDSRGSQELTAHTPDFNRRLAFAFALIGDTPPAG